VQLNYVKINQCEFWTVTLAWESSSLAKQCLYRPKRRDYDIQNRIISHNNPKCTTEKALNSNFIRLFICCGSRHRWHRWKDNLKLVRSKRYFYALHKHFAKFIRIQNIRNISQTCRLIWETLHNTRHAANIQIPCVQTSVSLEKKVQFSLFGL
jgi:hypothetical protein